MIALSFEAGSSKFPVVAVAAIETVVDNFDSSLFIESRARLLRLRGVPVPQCCLIRTGSLRAGKDREY